MGTTRAYKLPMIRRIAALALVSSLVACASASGEGTPTDDPGATTDETTPTQTQQQQANSTPTQSGPAFDPQFPDDKKDEPAKPAQTCDDKDDSIGSETGAKQLPATSDCDNDEKVVSGVMNGAVDVDFFKFSVADKFGCSFDPHFEAKTAGTEVCVFVSCGSGAATITKCDGGVQATSDIGTKGCCAAAPANVTPEWDCPGFTDNDSATVFVRVRQPAGNACLPYSWSYHF